MVTTLTKGSYVQSIVGQTHYVPPGVREQEVYTITHILPFVHSKSNHKEASRKPECRQLHKTSGLDSTKLASNTDILGKTEEI